MNHTSISSTGKPELNVLETEFYKPFVKHFEGFDHYEIAHMLELPVATVKQRIKLARKVLHTNFNIFQSDFKINLNA